mgnify:CR=1 FL=1
MPDLLDIAQHAVETAIAQGAQFADAYCAEVREVGVDARIARHGCSNG